MEILKSLIRFIDIIIGLIILMLLYFPYVLSRALYVRYNLKVIHSPNPTHKLKRVRKFYRKTLLEITRLMYQAIKRVKGTRYL